jgi:acetoin utilization deacetylase AcuC-like enzyme
MKIITSPRFGEHATPPGHPERIERAEVFDAVAARWADRAGAVAPVPAARQDLLRVHDAHHVARMYATAGRAVMLDEDTFTSPETHEVALLAAGAAIQAAGIALSGEAALAMVRPPGHHAERARAMGFCFYNNVAVAAAGALAGGLERVAIVDIDVHHGNGTQWIFYEDPRVLYISSHQFPFYPGTGAAGETGTGAGRGFTVNIPLEAGARDADYLHAYSAIVQPVLAQFSPQLVIVSAGFDAHERDPLASMRVTTGGYRQLLGALRAWSGPTPLAVVTEGGYDLDALDECLEATLSVLDANVVDDVEIDAAAEAAPRGARAVAAVRTAQSRFWAGL